MQEKTDRFSVPRSHIILKPIWEFLNNPHPGNANENALNGGIRFVDVDKQKDMNTTLMQGVQTGHVVHVGDIAMVKERLMFHLPAFNGTVGLAIGILTMEMNGHTLSEKDILTKGRIIEQPVPSDDDEPMPDKPVLMPYYMKPPIEDLLKEEQPVPEIDDLIAGRIIALRPFALSEDYEVPQKLRDAVKKGTISTTSVFAQNFISVYSRPDRRFEAKELVDIVRGARTTSTQESVKRIREILRLEM